MAEDGEYQAPGEQLERMMARLMGQFGAIAGEAMRPERFEYRLCAWDEVNELASDGWELRAAHVELTRFVMSRKLSAADEAAALLAQAQRFGVLFGPPPAPLDDAPAPEDSTGGLEG